MLLAGSILLAWAIGYSYVAALTVRQESPSVVDAEDMVQEGTQGSEKVMLPSGNFVVVYCDSQLGAGLEARACFDALNTGPRGSQQEIWVNEGIHPPPGHAVVHLPQMLFNNDTDCIIEPALAFNFQSAHASAENVTEAARAIIQTCVIRRRVGGRAYSIGGDNRLSVRVMGNSIRPECTGDIQATPHSCQYILDEMYKDRKLEIFGKFQRPVTVALPLTLRAPDGLCQMVVDTQVPSRLEYATWFSVWFHASLVNAGCVRQGKGGKLRVRGKDQAGRPSVDMIVEIMDEPAGLALPGNGNSSQQESPSATTA